MEKIDKEKLDDDTFSLWQEEGRSRTQQNFEMFHSLVTQAREYAQRSQYEAAAVYAEMASTCAFYRHCGILSSPELEYVLLSIGRQAIKSSHYYYSTNSTQLSEEPKRILHVTTGLWDIGGHSRLIGRWIQQDTKRSHSIVLTRQGSAGEIPKIFRDAVQNSQGKIYQLDEIIGGLISRAKKLRKIAASADVVVLHTMEDVIPIIAFANKEQSPPIIFVNHSDERIFPGVSISDVIANLRESGMSLSRERRGIEAERNALLPIVLSPIYRTLSRTEAKQQLGLSSDSIVLLSIARSNKYKSTGDISFADAHVQLLERHDRAVLLVIGPGDSEDWSAAIQQTQGRIKVLGHTSDTAVFYQAADIYVDSFPWHSNTSLLEAGCYGLPLVSYFPYSSNKGNVLSADMPGLTGNLISVHDLDEYTAVLLRLVKDEEFRLTLGEATRKKIVDTHIGSNWQCALEHLYSRAVTINKINVMSAVKDQMFLDEVDILLNTVFYYAHGQDEIDDIEKLITSRAGLMPFKLRFHIWARLIKGRGFGRMGRISVLLPQWLINRLYRFVK